MTFLNPYVLIGLAAASLPVLFHLFAQRKAKRIEFSSIQFLKKLEKSSMRKVKLRQILLLILRTLLIIALVMAFARPALRGYLGGFFGSSSANTSMVILFDNSASMGQRNSTGQYFKQAQDAALRVVSVMREGDEAVIIPIASLEKGKEYHPLHNKEEIRKAITDITLADASARVDDALRIASAELAKSLNINKEIYLITDNQKQNYNVRDSTSAKNDTAKNSLTLFDERSRLFIVDVGGDQTGSERNLSIDSLKAITTIFEPGRPIDFEVFIRNTGSVPIENESISLFYNDERVGQKSIGKLEPHTSERLTISAQPHTAGMLGVRAELEEDALPFDNKRFLSLAIPATRKVGLFFANSSDAEYLSLALGQTLTESSGTAYSTEMHRPEELRMLPSFSRFDAIIVGIGAPLDAVDVKALHDHIASGKAVAIFTLANIDIDGFNKNVAQTLGLPKIEVKEGSASATDKYVSFTQFDLSHPFFAGMFENMQQGARGIESPKIFEYYRFSHGGLPLIGLSGAASFLSEYSIGKGKLLLYSIPPTFAFSDFPRKSIFLPLVRRTAAYLASISGTAKDENETIEYFTDAPFDVELPQLQGEVAGSLLVVRSPHGVMRRMETVASPSGKLRIQMSAANEAGIYTIYKDAEARVSIASFAVNIRSREADLTRITPDEVRSTLAPVFITKEKAIEKLDLAKEDIAKQITESRFGVELWQSFLALALIFAIAEMLIAREGKTAPALEAA